MASYEFTLELSRDIIDSEAEIIKSSCGDAIIKNIPTGIDTGYTGTLVEFDREAESLEKAIESAMHDIEVAPDLHATGITIPAPEPARTEPSADAGPGANTEKKPSAKKASTRKPSARKTGSKKADAGQENGAT